MTTPDILKKYPPQQSYMMNILHEVQNNNLDNCIHNEDVKHIAKFYQINISQVQGVVDYYSMFSSKPQGKHIINVCKSPVCYLKGSDNIIEMLKQKLGVDFNQTTEDGLFTLRQVECLGQCDEAPMMGIGQKVFGELNDEKLDKIIDELRTTTNE